MGVSDQRYARDRARYDLAYSMLQLGARPQLVVRWTHLSLYQIKTLANQYHDALPRHRGRLPAALGWFWKVRNRSEQGAVLGGLIVMANALPPPGDASTTSETLGLRLCGIYRDYLRIIDRPVIPFEHSLLLMQELARRELIALRPCSRCGALMLADLLALRSQCPSCYGRRRGLMLPDIDTVEDLPIVIDVANERLQQPEIIEQLRLFD